MELSPSQRAQVWNLKDLISKFPKFSSSDRIKYLDEVLFPEVLKAKWLYLQRPTFRGILEQKLEEFKERAPNLVAKWRELFDIEEISN